MVFGWNTGMVVVPTATDELSTSSPAQQSPALTFSYWVNQIHTLPLSNGITFELQLWNFVNPQLSKNGSNVIDKVQVVFFPCSQQLVFNSCSCTKVKQINSNKKGKCTSHLFLFITYRYILVVFGIHQNIISFLQWLLSKQQFHCTLFPQLGYTSSLYVLAFLFVPK